MDGLIIDKMIMQDILNQSILLLGSTTAAGVVGAILGRRFQRAKTEGQEIDNLMHIIQSQSDYMNSMEKRFDAKCQLMEEELELNKVLITQQRKEIDALKKKLKVN